MNYAEVSAQVFSWARMETGNGRDVGVSITADLSGNVYTTGYFERSADFDPGAGTSYLTSAGFTDAFIQKVDASGNLVWAKQFGGTGKDYGVAVAADASGNVYVTGTFTGTIDVDPGAGVVNLTQVSSFNTASFLVKLNSSGNYVWGKLFGGSTGSIKINDMKLDAAGDVIAVGAGVFSNDMDPNAGTVTMTATYEDAFILKLTSAGIFSWVKQLKAKGSSTAYSEIHQMDIDRYGNIVVTGFLKDTTDFDPGAGVANFTGTGFNYFVAEYTSTGAYKWAGSVTGSIWSGDIATDTSGNVVVISQSTSTPIDFDISAGVNNIASANGNLCIQKLDSTGNLIWVKTWAQLGISFSQAICIDGNSDLYITSNFLGTKDFNPGAGVYNMITTSSPYGVTTYDNYILKLNAAGNFVSAIKYGSNFDDNVYSMYLDANGNIYSTGSYNGTGDFDPTAGVTNLNSNGGTEIFVQKLTNINTFAWAFGMGGETYQILNAVSKKMKNYGYAIGTTEGYASTGCNCITDFGGNDIILEKVIPSGSLSVNIRMGGASDDGGTAIISDTSENVYIAGYFNGTANLAASSIFDPAINLTSAGGKDIFIAKINSSSKTVWAKRIGSTSDEEVNGIALDNSGNLYLTGYYNGTVDFNPSTAVNNLTSAGGQDGFVLKLDTAGNYIWATSMGGTSNDIGNDIAVDASGNVITTGIFNGTADFDPSASTSNLVSAGNIDLFIQKLNSSGAFVWSKSIGSAGNDYGRQIIIDSVNNIICAGRYGGAADFDPGAGTFTLTPPNNLGEIFLLQLTSGGNFSWAKSMGGSGIDDVGGLNIDKFANIYLTGSYNGTADFDPSPTKTYNLTSNGGSDAYIICYNPSKDTIWAKSIGGTGYDDGVGLVLDNALSIYTLGNFSSTVDFDPNAGIYNLTSLGISDIYALKLSQPILLPIELVSFSAHCASQKVILNWVTASESGNDHFEIERSSDAVNFEYIGKVICKESNSTQLQNYFFDDLNPLTDNSYYRLKQVDKDGKFSYAKIVAVSCNEIAEGSEQFSLFPNPVKDKAFIQFDSKMSFDGMVLLSNIEGKLVYKKNIQVSSERNLIEMDLNNIAKGIYIGNIFNGNNKVAVFKIIKD